jgi:hypothetical protein
MTHWLMPWKRMTRPRDTASAPGVISPCIHSQMPTPPTEASSRALDHSTSMLSTVNRRICR